MPNHTPLISIVTIVYNDITHIAQTMDSVVMQSYENLEYIIIDGNSNDGTKERIVGYIKDCAEVTLEESSATESSPRFYIEATHKAKRNFTFKFLSERDAGIYDAMNKGIDLATGQWCNFMNCGDRFYAGDTIEELFGKFFERQGEIISLNHADQACEFNVIYGEALFRLDDTHSKIPKLECNPSYRMPFCHQSAFAKTTLLKKYHFDTSFKIHADGDFFTKIYNQGKQFFRVDMIVSVFDVNGISSKPSWQMFVEEARIVSRVSRLYVLRLGIHCLWNHIKYTIKTTLLPRSLGLKLASMYNAKQLSNTTSQGDKQSL